MQSSQKFDLNTLTFRHLAGKVSGHGAVVIVPHPSEASGRVDLHALVSFLIQTVQFPLSELLEVVDGAINPLETLS